MKDSKTVKYLPSSLQKMFANPHSIVPIGCSFPCIFIEAAQDGHVLNLPVKKPELVVGSME